TDWSGYTKCGRLLAVQRVDVGLTGDGVALRKLDDISNLTESEPDYRVGAAVIERQPSGGAVHQSTAGEHNVWNVSHAFVEGGWREDVRVRTRDHLPRLFQIEQHRSRAVDEAVTRRHHTVVNEEPTLGGFDRRRASSDLRALPTILLTKRRHDVSVPPPMNEVFAMAEV